MGLSIITSPVELWKFGSHERASRGVPLMLHTYDGGNVAAVAFSTFRLQGATAGYSVTAGKTLVVTRIIFQSNATTRSFTIGYSDADLGLTAAADGANAVHLDGVAANGLGFLKTLSSGVMYFNDCYYAFPAGKFPRMVESVGVADFFVQLFGHEV